ncbi:MAG TPA: biliverdin-producing heme oxygenase [Polyangiaceae bacterium]
MRSLHGQLRAATASLHERLEASVPLLRPSAGEHTYRWYLARLYGVSVPLERAVGGVAGLDALGLDLGGRRKSGALASDLAALGLEARALAKLPRCGFLPELSDVPAALGCLYVMEGASLGGQVLHRELSCRMPEPMRVASRYLRFYGAETGARWRTFLAALASYDGDAEASAAAVHTARATFVVLQGWLAEPPRRFAAGGATGALDA